MGKYGNLYVPALFKKVRLTESGFVFRTTDYEGNIKFENGKFNFYVEDVLIATVTTDGITLGGIPSQAGHAGEYLTTDGTDMSWSAISSTGSGDVTGPTSSTDNAIVRFHSTTGKVIQNSSATIDDSGNFTGGTVNGVTVQTHASRHNEGGSDPLTITNLTGIRVGVSVTIIAGETTVTFSSPLSDNTYALTLRCYTASGNNVDYQITTRTGNGFSITVPVTASVDYIAINN